MTPTPPESWRSWTGTRRARVAYRTRRVRRDGPPYALPADGAPIRVAFVGHPSYFAPHVLSRPAGGIVPTLIPFRGADKTPASCATRSPTPIRTRSSSSGPRGCRPTSWMASTRPSSASSPSRCRVPIATRTPTTTTTWPSCGRSTAATSIASSSPTPTVGRRGAARFPCGGRCRCRSTTGSTARRARASHPPRHDLRRPFDAPPRRVLIGLKHDFDLPHYAHGLIGPGARRGARRRRRGAQHPRRALGAGVRELGVGAPGRRAPRHHRGPRAPLRAQAPGPRHRAGRRPSRAGAAHPTQLPAGARRALRPASASAVTTRAASSPPRGSGHA